MRMMPVVAGGSHGHGPARRRPRRGTDRRPSGRETAASGASRTAAVAAAMQWRTMARLSALEIRETIMEVTSK